jgi:hypothetical protein
LQYLNYFGIRFISAKLHGCLIVYLFDVFGNGVSAPEGPDEGAGRDHGPLDRRGHLEGDVPERLRVVHVVGQAGQVRGLEGVLRVHDLEREVVRIELKKFRTYNNWMNNSDGE